MREPRKVAVVNAGGNMSLSAEKGDYDSLVGSLEHEFERRVRDGKPLLDVSVVRSTEEALKHVGRYGTIFYLTNGMAQEAEKVRREHPGMYSVRVVVLTGDLIDGVVYLGKQWVNMEVCADIAITN